MREELKKVDTSNLSLITDVTALIHDSRKAVASTINTALTLLYWSIGKRINDEILNGERAKYGKQIVVSLARQLSWTHFIALIPLKDPVQRQFYAKMCRLKKWGEDIHHGGTEAQREESAEILRIFSCRSDRIKFAGCSCWRKRNGVPHFRGAGCSRSGLLAVIGNSNCLMPIPGTIPCFSRKEDLRNGEQNRQVSFPGEGTR